MNDEGPADRPGIGRPTPDADRRLQVAGRIALADGTGLMVTVHCVDRFWLPPAARTFATRWRG